MGAGVGDVEDEDAADVEAEDEPGEVALPQPFQSFQAGLSMLYSPDVLSELAQWGWRSDPTSVM